MRSDDEGAIGVMFRYTDENSYYRFSMSREPTYRRLIKKVNGRVDVLWEDHDVRYIRERKYVLTIDCEGGRLTGYLDGVQIFSENNGELAAERIGLYCWKNTRARFAEVRVSAPVWVP